MTKLRAAFGALVIATTAGVGAAIGFGAARADVIPPPRACPSWQIEERGHGGSRCIARSCRRPRDCNGGSCAIRRVCIVTATELRTGPGPCRDMDGDGECDSRRVTVRRESGPCNPRGRCTTGRCETVGECRAPTPPPPG